MGADKEEFIDTALPFENGRFCVRVERASSPKTLSSRLLPRTDGQSSSSDGLESRANLIKNKSSLETSGIVEN